MVRRYEDPIEVRAQHGSTPAAPDAFLWRGRLYVVRDVLGHWRERRAWWREALDPGADAVGSLTDLEQEVWRVEASPGRMRGTGVYDLAHDGAAPGWRLLRVAD